MSVAPTPEQRLILAAASTYRVNPQGFVELVEAMRRYAEGTALSMVGCEAQDLVKMQGRAQALAQITKIFAEAPVTGPKVEEKLQNARG